MHQTIFAADAADATEYLKREEKKRDKSKADAHRRRESEEQLYSTIIDWLADQRET